MGGYAVYVWTAYGVTALVIALNVWLAERALRRTRASLGTPDIDGTAARQPTVRKMT